MSASELITVIIPTYNSGDYLKTSVGSVLEQTYQDLELILVDDKSSDEYTLDLLHDYAKNDPRIRLVFNKENMGTSRSRNYIVHNVAQGKYVTFLDHDDNFLPQFLEQAVAANEQNHTSLAFCHVGARKKAGTKAHCEREGQFIPAHWFDIAEKGALNSFVLQRQTILNDACFLFIPVCPHGKLFNLEDFRKANLDFKDNYSYEDQDWCLRILCAFPAYSLVPILGAERVVNDSSVSHSVNERLIQGMCASIQSRYEVIESNNLLPRHRSLHLLQTIGEIMSRSFSIEDPAISKQVKNQGFGVLVKQGFSMDEICKALTCVRRN